ncbi:hypothetical protein LRB59_01655 [Borreliella burgdorferi]|uniref:BB0569 family chemotaxis protein n=1 Tax=Borreliella burgdorferi TaxID=139 RepID=UPI00016B2C41|nr:hypothetical protein [Borreliella burgdorferi]EEC22172.1 conserved hypothetical protein [Borreliella burgdorferi 156a]MCD2331355.1 hypothetical protein [Borreliella burgdorferi]MCD2385695.1 hypothetical protein [Borreliella burgdorferi]MCD2408122.1 hypothetical protein [Borreliella burgdorferi]MDK7383008.1 hypothetical protein [Borreliella burgdorferi]
MDNDNNGFDANDCLATLFHKLEAFDESTRHIYSNLSKSIPKLIEKISKDSKDLSFSIDLISNLDLDNDSSLNNFIAKIIGALDDFVAYFNSSTTSLESQFSIIRSKVKDIEILEDVIERMKKSSLDMEIMSINTLTVAMRAGKAGGAFSYITSEIKVLTQSMIKQADQLTSKGREVKIGLDRAKNQVYESNTAENKILEEFRDNLMKKIDAFSDGIGSVIALYDDILKVLSEFKFKLVNSISYLQFQDRLTQSLQHLNIMYSNIDVFKFRDISEIQKLKILSVFTDTSKVIVKDVLEKLEKNYTVFEKFIDSSFSSIQTINDLRSDNSLYIDIPKIIEQFSSILSDLLRRIDDVEKNNSNFLNLYYEQVKLIKSLELMFSNISAISARFQNINIASKIEVVKRSELKAMEGNISEMSKIIKEIDSNITKGIEFLDQIIFFLEKVVKDYDNRFYLEKNYFNKFKKLFIEIKNDILDIKNIAIDNILSYEVFSIEFMEIFEEIKLEVYNVRNLKNSLLDIDNFLSNMESKINFNLNLELSKVGIQSVEIEDKEFINRIANRFTLFVHKKHLLSLIEEAKDVHSFDEGSVILF